MSNVAVTTQFITSLVASGQLTSTVALQEAVDEQTNSATSSTGAQPVNQAWGSAIPQLFGGTLTAGLPLWVGNFKQTTDSNGNTITAVDMAVLFGRGAPGYTKAVVLQVYLDDSQVWGVADPSIVQPSGAPLDFTFYTGLSNPVDPTIAAVMGANATPAFTGMMYMVLRNIVVDSVSVNALTSVPDVKLPQCRAQIVQQHASADTTVTIYGFANAPQDKPVVTQCCYDPVRHRMIHLLDTLGAVDIYNLDTARYVGRTKLVGYAIDPNNPNPPSVHFLWQDHTLCVTNRNSNLIHDGAYYYYGSGFWNINTGVLLNTVNNPMIGAPHQISDGRGLQAYGFQPSPGKFIDYTGDTALFDISDINNVVCITSVPFSGDHDLVGDYPFDTSDIGTGCGIYYYSNYNSSILYMGVDAGLNGPQTFGNITWDGSGRPLRFGQNAVAYGGKSYSVPHIQPMIVLEQHATIRGVFCDEIDSRYVYMLVASNGALTLRRYGNFFYFNPQDGSAPPIVGNAAFNSWYFGCEIQRIALPTFAVYAGSQGRDRRNPYITTSDGDTLYVINMRNMTYDSYYKGIWQDTNGFTSPAPKQFQTDSIYLPKFSAFTYYSQSDLPTGEQAGFGVPSGAVNYTAVYGLQQMFTDLSLLAGYSGGQVECDGLVEQVFGMQLNQQVTYADLIKQLAAAFRVDIIETPTGGIKFVRRPSNLPADITPDVFSLLPLDDQDTHVIGIDRVTTNELPRVLQLSFVSYDFGFVIGSVSVRRTTYPVNTQYGLTTLTLSVPVVMTNANAVYFAGLALFDMWAGQTNFTIKFPPKYIQAEVGDYVALTRPSGRVNMCQITAISLSQDRTIAVTLSSINASKPIPLYQGATGPTETPPALTSDGTLTTANAAGTYVSVIDNVHLETADATDQSIPLYFCASAAADVYLQPDNGSGQPFMVGAAVVAPIGECTSILPTLSPFRLDNNPILIAGVRIANLPALASNWRDGGNAVLIGAPGRWEMIYYGGITDTATGVSLSPVLRGRLGTDAWTQSHAPNDLAVWLPAGGPLRVDRPVTDLGSTYRVFGMPTGRRPSPVAGVYGLIVIGGGAQSPVSPTVVTGVRNQDRSITLSWHRRDRGAIPSDFWSDPALTDPNSYTVQISTAGGTPRIYSTTTNSVTYPVVDQTTDGNNTASRVMVSVAQTGNIVSVGLTWKGFVYVGN